VPVQAALGSGYRHIDTAAAYGNERQVGEPVQSADLDRSQVFLETKVGELTSRMANVGDRTRDRMDRLGDLDAESQDVVIEVACAGEAVVDDP
jgi:diketogulonate reductase-like aldo/keto reductase